MNNKLQKIVLVFILGFMQIVGVSYANKESYVVSGLEVKLSMPQGEYFAADALMLNFTLTNITSEPVTFLKWETPLENDFTGDMFAVHLEGQKIRYIGKLVKRAAPQENDFITLAAGESISGVIDLADGYAIENEGNYTLAFNKHLQIVDNLATKNSSKLNLKLAPANSSAVGFMLNEGRYMKQRAKQANFSSCDASQQSVLNNAHAAAIVIAEESLNSLNNTATSEQATAERYTTWFGSHTSSRYSTVTSHFTKIHDALANQQVTLHCDCTDSFFAYVFIGDEYNIHLCNAFWNAALKGTDSQAGTLIHETSHFTVVAATDDHVYGQNEAKILAINNPNNAIDNADSHEYFAENTPALLMEDGDGSSDDNSDGSTSNNSDDGTSSASGGGSFDQYLLYFLMLLGISKISRKYWLK
ncbi:MAG TPA: peptidase M35 [Thiothrix sp.]|nr:peptidase M35 [Thiothrix sp.]